MDFIYSEIFPKIMFWETYSNRFSD